MNQPHDNTKQADSIPAWRPVSPNGRLPETGPAAAVTDSDTYPHANTDSAAGDRGADDQPDYLFERN